MINKEEFIADQKVLAKHGVEMQAVHNKMDGEI